MKINSKMLAAAVVLGLGGVANAAPITLSRTNGDTVTDTSIRWFNSGATTDGRSTLTTPAYVGTTVYNDGNSYYFGRVLIRFDLSMIPHGAIINSANLEFYSGAGGDSAPASVYRLTNSFTSAATWSSRDGTTNWDAWAAGKDQDHAAAATATVNTGNNRTFDVKSDVQLFVNGTANYGWDVIGLDDSPATSNIYWGPYISATSQYTNGNARPQLVIDYTPVPEPASALLLAGVGGMMMLRRRRRVA